MGKRLLFYKFAAIYIAQFLSYRPLDQPSRALICLCEMREVLRHFRTDRMGAKRLDARDIPVTICPSNIVSSPHSTGFSSFLNKT